MISFKEVYAFVERLFGEEMHEKRVESLSNATLGVMATGSLAVHLIGEGLAQVKEKTRKHCIKQVDRLPEQCALEGLGSVHRLGALPARDAQTGEGSHRLD